MCRYQQKLTVHLQIGEGPRVLYRSLLDIGTDAEVRDSDNHLVADDLFFPKDACKLNCSDIRNIVMAGYEASKYNGKNCKCRKGRVRTGKIGIISWNLKVGEFSVSYDAKQLNIYSGYGLVISEKVDIPEFEKFPVNAKLLRSEMKRRLTEFHENQLKKIKRL